MKNDELITLNEVLNNGNRIYFYEDEVLGVWRAWGYSAYHLAHMTEIDCVTSFSERMQMPYTCITAVDFRALYNKNMKSIECKDGIYSLETDKCINPDLYKDWVTNLK